MSHEPSPSTTKDVSPPPVAPSAPAFGSVPSRQPTSSDLQTLTGKAPPTGPRALADDRPVSAGHSVLGERLPPTGPSKPTLLDNSSHIPVGPRAQQRFSKGWLGSGPSSAANKTIAETPKANRSQSFVSQQGRPPPFGYRPESSHSDHHGDFERRPRSSGAKSESQLNAADGQLRGLHLSEPNGVALNLERGTRSARASVDRETGNLSSLSRDSKTGAADSTSDPRPFRTVDGLLGTAPRSKPGDDNSGEDKTEAGDATVSGSKPTKPITVQAPAVKFALPANQPLPPAAEQLSESDDEDMDIYFDSEMAKAEAELSKLERPGDASIHSNQPNNASGDVPIDLVSRYITVSFEAMTRMVTEMDGFSDMVGPIPENFKFIPEKEKEAAELQTAASNEANEVEMTADLPSQPDTAPTDEPAADSSVRPEPQPKVEDTDMAGSGLPSIVTAPGHPSVLDVDTEMKDSAEAGVAPGSLPGPLSVNGASAETNKQSGFPVTHEAPASQRASPSQMEEDDETEEEEIDYATVETVRQYMKTPPLEDLPNYAIKPWQRSKKVRNAYDITDDLKGFMLLKMEEGISLRASQQDDLRVDYKRRYEAYLRFTLSDDPIATKSRDNYAKANTPISTPGGKPPPVQEAKPEGGRRTASSRFSTELDLEYVMQQSILEHRQAQEREARAQKEKYASDKEALIPTMYWSEEDRDKELYVDYSGLLSVDKLVATWQVLPPDVNFTEEEAQQFEKAYLEFPKQWGNIAKQIPTRDFKACIEYYYAKKNELNLKEKLKKQPRKRKKGRGKQRSSALVSELGNTEGETEEGQENGENGERRRPRRAAAPTWGYEATPAADSDGALSTATSSRRGAKNGDGTDKPEGAKKGRRTRAVKDKEAKAPKAAQTLAPTPPASKANRSRSNSRAQGTEWVPPSPAADGGRLPTQLEMPQSGMQPPMPPVQQPPLASPDRLPLQEPSSISGVMAPPSLRPDPPPPPSSVPTFDLVQPSAPGHAPPRAPQQASSYWSVAETNDFPLLLRSFGTEWASIAAHMGSKTTIMVCLTSNPLL